MISTEKINTILELTAEVFSKPPQSDMLAFFVRKRKENDYQGPREGWIQCEIIRKLDDMGLKVTLKEKRKRDCDFIVDDIGVELKVSTSFSYEGDRELFGAIRSQHKNADCWMLITKFDEDGMRKLRNELSSEFPHLEMHYRMIPEPKWCAIVVAKKSDL